MNSRRVIRSPRRRGRAVYPARRGRAVLGHMIRIGSRAIAGFRDPAYLRNDLRNKPRTFGTPVREPRSSTSRSPLAENSPLADTVLEHRDRPRRDLGLRSDAPISGIASHAAVN